MNSPPIQITQHQASGDLSLSWGDKVFRLTGEFLRVHSPSAESKSQGGLIAGKKGVKVTGCETIGRYALKIRFSDGHDSGIYPWALLKALCVEQASRWEDYLTALHTQGYSREPDTQVVNIQLGNSL